MKGYGRLIQDAMAHEGYTPVTLAKEFGKEKGFIYRIQAEVQEPTMEEVNILAARLRLSVDVLLLAMGAKLQPSAANRLPNSLIDILVLFDRPSLGVIEELAHALLLRQRERLGKEPL